MLRDIINVPVFTLLAVIFSPVLVAQSSSHDHAGHESSHGHSDPVVSCIELASPPWIGLSDSDRELIAVLEANLQDLNTTQAARAAGFRPLGGDIPSMGVHYISQERTNNGVRAEEPDHLLFARIDGEEQLVGAAYAYLDTVDAELPNPFQSDLAHWHDHPEIAPPGQTLHMLHVWFVPSSNGPFAGMNYWLSFRTQDIAPPSTCWMSDLETAELIKQVAFALAPANSVLERMLTRGRGFSGAPEVPSEYRLTLLESLSKAAIEQDKIAWKQAAVLFLADQSEAEQQRSRMFQRILTNAQMSSAEREVLSN